MKNYFNKLKTIAASALLILFAASCSQEEMQPRSYQEQQIPADDAEKFEALGYDLATVSKIDTKELLDPLYEANNYIVEGDIVITPESLDQMYQLMEDKISEEQFRTTNLVSCPRIIDVLGFDAGYSALDATMKTALQRTINNYNSLNMGLKFSLTYDTANYSSYDIVFYKVHNGARSAGYPSGGDPYQYVQVQSGISNNGINVVEHYMTHQMGHTLGLRHTDYFDRSYSCGTGGHEGDAGVGAILVGCGSPILDPQSIMLACFGISTKGVFSQADIAALECMYNCP